MESNSDEDPFADLDDVAVPSSPTGYPGIIIQWRLATLH